MEIVDDVVDEETSERVETGRGLLRKTRCGSFKRAAARPMR